MKQREIQLLTLLILTQSTVVLVQIKDTYSNGLMAQDLFTDLVELDPLAQLLEFILKSIVQMLNKTLMKL